LRPVTGKYQAKSRDGKVAMKRRMANVGFTRKHFITTSAAIVDHYVVANNKLHQMRKMPPMYEGCSSAFQISGYGNEFLPHTES